MENAVREGNMTKTNRRYQIPASSELALKDGLSAKLKELWASAQGSSFDLFLYAAGLRDRYLDKKAEQYSPEFQEWYAKQEIHQLLGKMPSFTKYAMAGKVVSFFANDFKDGKYINHLPITRSALYEIWLLKELVSASDLEKLFFKGGDEDEGLIHPSASAADIAAYRNRLQFKSSSSANKSKSKKFNIPLATIYVSRDLYKFQKGTGEHVGTVDLEDAKRLLAFITGKLNAEMFDIRDNLTKISTTYKKKADAASPSAALRKLRTKKATKKKPRKS
jgi:hypothetical protein